MLYNLTLTPNSNPIYIVFLILEIFQLFTIEYDVSCGFIIYDLHCAEVCSLSDCFLESCCLFFFFIMNDCWILSKAFPASIEMIIWFLFFNYLMCCITLIDFQILKNSCTPGTNPTWSWCAILLMYCQIQFASILLRIFVSIFSDIECGYWPDISHHLYLT